MTEHTDSPGERVAAYKLAEQDMHRAAYIWHGDHAGRRDQLDRTGRTLFDAIGALRTAAEALRDANQATTDQEDTP